MYAVFSGEQHIIGNDLAKLEESLTVFIEF